MSDLFSKDEIYEHSFTVSDDDMQNFARLSGDENRLHTDDAFAKAKGLKGRVVYGALLVSKLSTLIGMNLPTEDVMWLTNDIKFKKPVYVGDGVVIQATVKTYSEAVQILMLDIKMLVGDTIVSSGSATVRIMP